MIPVEEIDDIEKFYWMYIIKVPVLMSWFVIFLFTSGTASLVIGISSDTWNWINNLCSPLEFQWKIFGPYYQIDKKNYIEFLLNFGTALSPSSFLCGPTQKSCHWHRFRHIQRGLKIGNSFKDFLISFRIKN